MSLVHDGRSRPARFQIPAFCRQVQYGTTNLDQNYLVNDGYLSFVIASHLRLSCSGLRSTLHFEPIRVLTTRDFIPFKANIRDQCSNPSAAVNPLLTSSFPSNDIPQSDPQPASPIPVLQPQAPISALTDTTPNPHLVAPPRAKTHARKWSGRNLINAVADNRRQFRQRVDVP